MGPRQWNVVHLITDGNTTVFGTIILGSSPSGAAIYINKHKAGDYDNPYSPEKTRKIHRADQQT